MTREVAHDHHCRCGNTFSCPPGCILPITLYDCGECRIEQTTCPTGEGHEDNGTGECTNCGAVR